MRSVTTWGVYVVFACLGAALPACREREPVPAYSENLGTAERPLMPTPLTQYDAALGKGGKKVDLPKRPEPGEKAPAPEPPDGGEDAAPAAEDAGSNGAAPAQANADTSGAPAAEDADTSGAPAAENAGTSGQAP